MRKPAVDAFLRCDLEAELIKIEKAKALIGQTIHGRSQIKIGDKNQVDYLSRFRITYLPSRQEFNTFSSALAAKKHSGHRGRRVKRCLARTSQEPVFY